MPDRSPAFFIANSLGLDFLNSIATPVDTPVDWLDSGEGLVAWLAQAKLVPTQALNALTEQATPGELDKVADQARVLREWFRGFVRTHMGRPLAPNAIRELTQLNALLERDEMFSEYRGASGRPRRSFGAANDAALAIARISIAADRRNASPMRVRRGLRQHPGV